MDWYPLWNSLRIALISCAAVFFLGIFAAYYIARLPRMVKGVLDVLLTLPMVLPPTVVGYFLLLLFGAKRPLGIFFMEHFGVKLVMNWVDENGNVSGERYMDLLAGADARLPSGHSGGHSAGFCPGTGRIRRYQHDRGLHPRQDRHHCHHGLPALAHQR